jgi:hypothetical protein
MTLAIFYEEPQKFFFVEVATFFLSIKLTESNTKTVIYEKIKKLLMFSKNLS